MKKILFVSLSIFLLMPSLTFAASAPQSLDKIVVVLNSEVITQSQLQKQIDNVKKQSNNMQLPDDATLRQKVLDQLIDERLILMLAKRNNLTVSDKMLNQALTSIAARNNLSLSQLQGAVEKQGINYNDFRQQIRDQILVQQVEMQALGRSLMVSNQEIKDFLREHPSSVTSYHIQDILVPSQQRAEDLAQQLKTNGTNQAQILAAAKDSNINDLGFRTAAQLPDIFATQIQDMKVGEIKGPIQAPNGFHLIKLVATKSTGEALTTNQVRQLLMQQKLAKNLPSWLKQIRSTAYVKIMD